MRDEVNHQDAKAPRIDSTNKPTDSVLDERHIEIDQQAQAFARKFQIGQNLGLMNGQESFDRFNFNDDEVVDDEMSLPALPTSSVVSSVV